MTQSKDGSGSQQSAAHSIKKSLKDLFKLTCIICPVNIIHKPAHELSADRAIVNPGLCSSAACRWCSRMPCKSIKTKLKQIRAFKFVLLPLLKARTRDTSSKIFILLHTATRTSFATQLLFYLPCYFPQTHHWSIQGHNSTIWLYRLHGKLAWRSTQYF